MISQLLVMLLFCIALVVFIGVMHRDNMWACIALYWAVLFIKNILEYYGI